MLSLAASSSGKTHVCIDGETRCGYRVASYWKRFYGSIVVVDCLSCRWLVGEVS